MKKVLLSLFCLVTLSTFSQSNVFPFDSISGEVYYTEVKEINLSKEKLFSNAKIWLATNLTSYKKSVDMEDIVSGKIIAKIINQESSKLMVSTEEFVITIDCKDKKFRYKIGDIKFETFLHMDSGDSHFTQTMADFRKFYLDGKLEAASKHALELNQKFKDFGTSIVKGMTLNDDF